MANQNFRVKNGLEVGGVEIANSTGVVNASSLPASGASAGTTGNSTTIPVITVNAKGLVTNVQSASVSGVSNYIYTSSNSTFTLSTGDGSTYNATIGYANTTVAGLVKVGDLVSVNATGFINVDESSIDIHNLSGYVANEHIDHSGVTMTAGNGLTGGGTIAATRTFAVEGNTGITVSSDGVFTNDSEIVHDDLSGFVANEHIDHSSVSVVAGTGLTGGGDITSSRTLNIAAGKGLEANSTSLDVRANTGIVANSTGVFTNDSEIVHDSLSGFVANEHIDHSGVTMTAGNGLTGGGDITATRTFAVGAGNGISVNSTAVAVDAGTGVVSNSTGVHIGQAVGTTASVTFGNITVSGNLTVEGTTTSIDTNNLVVNDAIITVASNQSGTPSLDAGIEVERGSSANALLLWDESADRWIQKLAGGTEYNIHTTQHDVVLGTHTSGPYVSNVSGTSVVVSNAGGDGSTPSLAVKANTGLTANSSGVFTNDSEIVHDSLSGFVANEHIDHSGVSISAGNGLSGGGDITATRSLAVVGNTGITVSSDGVFTNDSEIVHDSLSGFVANEHIDHSGVSITAGNGLSGGGTIAATRSLAVDAQTGLVANSSGLFTADSQIVHDDLSGFVANEHIDHSAVTLTAGNGLTGGGDITSSRSFAVTGGTGVTSNSTGVHIGQAVATSSDVTFNDVTVSADLIDGSSRTLKIYNAAGAVVWG